jgi:hypothetical protein
MRSFAQLALADREPSNVFASSSSERLRRAQPRRGSAASPNRVTTRALRGRLRMRSFAHLAMADRKKPATFLFEFF